MSKKLSLCSTLIVGGCAWLAFVPWEAAAQGRSSSLQTVTASFYSSRYDGRRTASGERFSSSALTAAHREMPFGTRVRLTNLSNQKSVVVRVNDRGPFVKGRDISVTRAAARRLGFTRAGTAQVSMEVLAGRE